MDARRFQGRVVVVVGAAQGVGAVTAEGFLAEGASVVMADVSPEVVERAAELGERFAADGAQVVGHVLDIVDPVACEGLAAVTEDRFGRIDVLAVIAGVIQEARPVDQLDPGEWDRVMGVNSTGPFLLARAVVPLMKKGGYGRIVNISSFFGEAGHPLFAAYCSSKAAVRVFTQVLAAECAEYGITVNAIAPGMINTSMHRQALEDEAEERGVPVQEIEEIEWGKIPLGKAGDPSDIADAVLYLSSDQAKYVTGACLDVNGGVLFR